LPLLVKMLILHIEFAKMRSIALVLAVFTALSYSCSCDHKGAKTDTAGYDTVRTDSGVTIIKDQAGKVVNTVPTSSLPNTGKNAGQNVTATIKDSTNHGSPAQEYPYYIQGVYIKGEGGNITLDQLGTGNDIKPLYVQATNSEGRFGFNGQCSGPELMQLRLPDGNIQFVVRPNDSIDFTIVFGDAKNYKVYGSPESLQLEEVFNILNDANAKKMVMEDKLKRAKNDMPLYVRLLDKRVEEYKRINIEKRASLMKYIDKIDTSYVTLLAAVYLDPLENFEYLKKLDKKMATRYANTPFYKSLHEKVSTYETVDIGKFAPEIISQTPEGKTIKLSSLKGKVVFLNFWAQYSSNSREENPHLEKLYKKYKDKGFEIVSYSVDKKRIDWTTAIKDDHMNWINLSDLLGYGSGGAETYVISDVPSSFLIDRTGRIVAKNITGKELDKKLEQLIH